MRSNLRLANFLGLLAVLVIAACETAPVTGRDQLILFPESQDAELGLDAYRQILAESTLSQNRQYNAVVQKVGKRIAAVSPHPDWNWQFTVIEDETPNAFALPGGKVGVHTGLFKVAQDEAQLAAVMGHEIAHAVARHGSERMSRQLLLQGGLAALGIGAGAATDQAGQYVQLAATAATLGVVLPFSRQQESEADQIGLLYMARAGYDPRAAVDLWWNFDAYGGERPPEFLSTHPAPGSRIARLQSLMPAALEAYRAN